MKYVFNHIQYPLNYITITEDNINAELSEGIRYTLSAYIYLHDLYFYTDTIFIRISNKKIFNNLDFRSRTKYDEYVESLSKDFKETGFINKRNMILRNYEILEIFHYIKNRKIKICFKYKGKNDKNVTLYILKDIIDLKTIKHYHLNVFKFNKQIMDIFKSDKILKEHLNRQRINNEFMLKMELRKSNRKNFDYYLDIVLSINNYSFYADTIYKTLDGYKKEFSKKLKIISEYY